jgi:hypothetical protein
VRRFPILPETVSKRVRANPVSTLYQQRINTVSTLYQHCINTIQTTPIEPRERPSRV